MIMEVVVVPAVPGLHSIDVERTHQV